MEKSSVPSGVAQFDYNLEISQLSQTQNRKNDFFL